MVYGGLVQFPFIHQEKKRQVIDPFDWRIESEVPRFLSLSLYILKTDIDLIPILSYGLFHSIMCLSKH